MSVTDPVKTERLTAPFARLFNPVLVVAVTAAFLWLTWWLLLDKGLASATHDAFHRPGLLLAVFAGHGALRRLPRVRARRGRTPRRRDARA